MHDTCTPTGLQGPQPDTDGAIAWMVHNGFCNSVDEAEAARCKIEDVAPAVEDPQGDWLPTRSILPAVTKEEVIQAIWNWRIVALGHRPEDHLVRDVLCASLLRDRRTRMFHRMSSEPPEWVEERVKNLPHRSRSQAVQCTVLDYAHRALIGRLWRGQVELQGPLGPGYQLINGAGYGLLLSLAACRPAGALLEWRGELARRHDFVCGYCRVCPWCHGRAVAALYRKLMAGPCRPERLHGKHLIRLRLRIGSAELATHQPFLEFAKQRGVDLSRATAFERSSILTRAEVQLARAFWFEDWMRRFGATCGIEGGIWTFQVEPYLNRYGCVAGESQYRFEMNVIGATVQDGNYRRRPLIALDRDFAAAIEIDEAPAGDPQALRRLLAGAPYKSGPNQPAAQSNELHQLAEQDFGGALRLVPWFLIDGSKPESGRQWWSCYEATRGSRLFATFGSWREGSARSKETVETRRLKPLTTHNNWKKQRTRRCRKKLLAQARDVYADLVARSALPPGRRTLRQALARNYCVVSERDARWLIQELGKTTSGSK